MPVHESDELRAVRQAGNLLTHLRQEAAEAERSEITISIGTLGMLERQMWTAYAYACEAEAKRED